VYYGTDGTYHDWYLKSCFFSASQGKVHCLSTQFGGLIVYPYNLGPSCLSTIHNLGFQKNEFPPISCFQACVNLYVN